MAIVRGPTKEGRSAPKRNTHWMRWQSILIRASEMVAQGWHLPLEGIHEKRG